MSKNKKFYSGKIPFDYKGNLLNHTDGFLYFSYCKSYNAETKILIFDGGRFENDVYVKEEIKLDLNSFTVLDGPRLIERDGGSPHWWAKTEVVWKENYIFEAKMRLEGFERGRSAAHALLLDESGKKYTLFLTDLEDILKREGLSKGTFPNLKWTFCKRGANYGVVPIFTD